MKDNDEILKSEIHNIHKRLLESIEGYRKTISYMYGDAPIGVLCLPKVIESVLISNGCLRVYDLFDRDLTEIKGIGHSRIRDLTSRLDEFLAVR